MKDIFSIDFRDAIRKVVRRELKEKFAIKPPKEKLNKCQDGDNESKLFGVPLGKIPSKSIKDDQYFSVPMFLIDAFEYLNEHVKVEGLFRKSGSVGRQRMLREILERDGTCCSCDFVQPHDVAALVKQFFRELPDSLLTGRYSPLFIKCLSLNNMNDAISAIALCCLLLPDENLRVLKYFTKFIAEVANHSVESKMTLNNLAIVFAPNLMCTAAKDRNSEKSMKEATQIVDLLFKNSHLIGMVPDALYTKAVNINTEGGFYSSSGDELDTADEGGRQGRTLARSDKKRDRSKSITGFLKRNFKQNERGTPKPHARSRSEKAVSLRKTSRKNSLTKRNSENDMLSNEKGSKDQPWRIDRATKRPSNTKTNISPVRKSPRLAHKPVISPPTLKSMPHQVHITPRRHLHPVENSQRNNQQRETKEKLKGPVLPSKFEFTRATSEKVKASQSNIKLSRSKSSNTYMPSTQNTTELTIPQPKISRSTQKPHVRKSRRASSMDRRRARYASSNRIRRVLPKTPIELAAEASKNSVTTSTNEEEINTAFLEKTSSPLDTSPNADVSNDSSTSKSSLHGRKNITSCTRKQTDENSPVTPEGKTIQRSISTAVRKPATPYSVTPQVGVKRLQPFYGVI